jgi:CheY-like chemotaxis protein
VRKSSFQYRKLHFCIRPTRVAASAVQSRGLAATRNWHGLRLAEGTVFTATASSACPDLHGRTRTTTPRRRVLIAGNDRGVLNFLGPALTALGIEVRSVRTAADLERALVSEGPFHLVVTSVSLPDKTGLGVLTHARSLRICTPFVLVAGVKKPHVRILVSNDPGDVLSTRFVDERNLVALATELMRGEPAPAG